MTETSSPLTKELNINILSRGRTASKKQGIRVRCFICHREIDQEMVAFVNHSLKEAACVCGKHMENPEKNPDQ